MRKITELTLKLKANIDELKKIAPPSMSFIERLENVYDCIKKQSLVKSDIVFIARNIYSDLIEDVDFRNHMDEWGIASLLKKVRHRKKDDTQLYVPSIEKIIHRGVLKPLGTIFIHKTIPLFLFTDWENKNSIPENNIIMGNSNNFSISDENFKDLS